MKETPEELVNTGNKSIVVAGIEEILIIRPQTSISGPTHLDGSDHLIVRLACI